RTMADRSARGVAAVDPIPVAVMSSLGFRPRSRRRFGQHFLSSEWAQKVVHAIGPERGDVFLEIGPGTGALTLPLAQSGAPILAIEIDRDLAAELAARVPPNVTLMTADFLASDVLPFLAGLDPQRPAQSAGASTSRRLRAV